MSAFIHNIECTVPQTSYSQPFIAEKMKGWIRGDRVTNRQIDSIYGRSDIEKRHTVISDPDAFFKTSGSGPAESPTTAARNTIFTTEARRIYVQTARKVLTTCDHICSDEITHLITVSCTGFFNPGPDFEIVKQLGLNRTVQRFNIGFMGCYAAFPALRLAKAICESDPNAVVLVVAVELCTLHAQLKKDTDSLLAGALFADGGAAAIISAKSPGAGKPVLQLHHCESTLIPDSESEMAWAIGDNGFEMTLTQYVPKIIEANIAEIVLPILKGRSLTVSGVDYWAVHPGGKAILDRIESCLGLNSHLDDSRWVLSQYGNMSSVTVLFVLKRIMAKPMTKADESIVAMAFGPGLTVEVAFMGKIAAPRVPQAQGNAETPDKLGNVARI